jgi:DNA-binding LacI/PurR family transcriptional regulator
MKRAASDGCGKNTSFTAVISEEKTHFGAGRKVTKQLLETAAGVSTLICATDEIAMGALYALHEAGVDVPGKIAVTGFDDIPAAAQFIPPITTIRQPIEAMIKQAFKTVMDTADSGEISFPGELIIRQTA